MSRKKNEWSSHRPATSIRRQSRWETKTNEWHQRIFSSHSLEFFSHRSTNFRLTNRIFVCSFVKRRKKKKLISALVAVQFIPSAESRWSPSLERFSLCRRLSLLSCICAADLLKDSVSLFVSVWNFGRRRSGALISSIFRRISSVSVRPSHLPSIDDSPMSSLSYFSSWFVCPLIIKVKIRFQSKYHRNFLLSPSWDLSLSHF